MTFFFCILEQHEIIRKSEITKKEQYNGMYLKEEVREGVMYFQRIINSVEVSKDHSYLCSFWIKYVQYLPGAGWP